MEDSVCMRHPDRPGRLRNIVPLCCECRDALDAERDRQKADAEEWKMEKDLLLSEWRKRRGII